MQLKQIPLLIYSSIWEIRNFEISNFVNSNFLNFQISTLLVYISNIISVCSISCQEVPVTPRSPSQAKKSQKAKKSLPGQEVKARPRSPSQAKKSQSGQEISARPRSPSQEFPARPRRPSLAKKSKSGQCRKIDIPTLFLFPGEL